MSNAMDHPEYVQTLRYHQNLMIFLKFIFDDVVAEWLRRQTANLLCSARMSSNLIHVDVIVDEVFSLTPYKHVDILSIFLHSLVVLVAGLSYVFRPLSELKSFEFCLAFSLLHLVESIFNSYRRVDLRFESVKRAGHEKTSSSSIKFGSIERVHVCVDI